MVWTRLPIPIPSSKRHCSGLQASECPLVIKHGAPFGGTAAQGVETDERGCALWERRPGPATT